MNRTLVVGRRTIACAALVGLMSFPAFGSSSARVDTHGVNLQTQRRPLPPSPACIVHKKVSRFREGGYDHIVRITNGCAGDAECTVYSDSNPRSILVMVKAATTQAVVVASQARSSYFVPTVSCVMRA
jgi:hypothetical protein